MAVTAAIIMAGMSAAVGLGTAYLSSEQASNNLDAMGDAEQRAIDQNNLARERAMASLQPQENNARKVEPQQNNQIPAMPQPQASERDYLIPSPRQAPIPQANPNVRPLDVAPSAGLLGSDYRNMIAGQSGRVV
jgi:hypothetical protein